MKKIIQFILISSIAFSVVGCDVKQNQLVVIEKNGNSSRNVQENLTLDFNMMPQKISIEKNGQILQKIGPSSNPLAVSADTGTVICFSYVDSKQADEINSKIVTGNMTQPVNLYAVDTDKHETHSLGEFLSLKDFQFDASGRLFAFVDGSSNIYIYDIGSKQLQKILEGKNYYSYDSISWSKDSKKLLINQRMTLDISSKQLISFAVNAYNPFIEQKYNNQEIYIVQMKNNEYNDMIALYNFDSKSFKSLANGVFLDSDNINLIYTKQSLSSLCVLNMETLESKTIENGPVYNAKIMKSTGDILYTTVNTNLNGRQRYLLVKFNPSTNAKKSIELTTPTFYLSPSESKLYFIGDYNENRISVDTSTLNVSQRGNAWDAAALAGIKATILKMFQLDYSFLGTYEEYENQAEKIYINTYDPIPQEALENKLIDFKRFNMPLPSWQKEPVIPPTIVLSSIIIKGNRASANIGLFFVNAIELVKEENEWHITGFSTHPDSKEIKDIRAVVQKHISDIKTKNTKEALKYWKDGEISDADQKQLQLVEDLIKDAASYKIEIGEIELWSLKEPHRAESPQTAEEAKVKIILSNDTNAKKYKLTLNRNPNHVFSIEGWSIDPLSISQLK
jgi:hypothetical protein